MMSVACDMSRFSPGQQVSYDDYLWDVASESTENPVVETDEVVLLWDGYESYVWAPVDDVYEY